MVQMGNLTAPPPHPVWPVRVQIYVKDKFVLHPNLSLLSSFRVIFGVKAWKFR